MTASMGQSVDSGIVPRVISDSHIMREETVSDGKSIGEVP